MKFLISLITAACVSILAVLIIFTPEKCEHKEMGKIFSFQPQNSTACSYSKQFCKNCNKYFGYTSFKVAPDDTSYLEVVKEYIDDDEIFAGEYYIMTAVLELSDYNVDKTRIRCKIESEDTIVSFSVLFQDKFEDSVASLQEGDEIKFRGRLYDEGFGWTDCELI